MNVGKKAKAAEGTAFLEGYLTCAKEMDIPLRAVCERLGEILSAQGQRTSKYLPQLRSYSKRNTPRSKAVEQVESVSNSHRRAPSSRKGKKQKWWYKLTAKQKQVVIEKRKATYAAKLAAKREAA